MSMLIFNRLTRCNMLKTRILNRATNAVDRGAQRHPTNSYLTEVRISKEEAKGSNVMIFPGSCCLEHCPGFCCLEHTAVKYIKSTSKVACSLLGRGHTDARQLVQFIPQAAPM